MNRPREIIIWGGTGQAKVIRPILEGVGHKILAVFDDTPNLPPPFNDIPLFEGLRVIDGWLDGKWEAKIGFCIAIGNPYGQARLRLDGILSQKGVIPVSVFHPQAIVAPNALLGHGIQVLAGAVVAPEAKVGNQCIINHLALLDHESELGDGGELAPGAIVCGSVVMGTNVWIGANATVLPRLTIGNDAIIGAGAVVTRNIPAKALAVGVPARIIKMREI